MQVVVMKEATKTRIRNMGKSLVCKFCGEEIREGELAVRRQRRNRNTYYVHLNCDEEHRI